MSNPYTAVREIVVAALTEFSGVTDLVPVGRIQSWNRAVDIRGEVENASDMGARIWIVPGRHSPGFGYSNTSNRWTRNYRIGYGVGTLQVEKCEEIEWRIDKALARLENLKQADGTTPIVQPDPLVIETAKPLVVEVEREPLDDPDEWNAYCDVVVVGHVDAAALRN